MALTTSSRFSGFRVYPHHSEKYTDRVSLRTTDGTGVRISFAEGYPESGTEERTNLDVLIEIYNSAAGFLDENGNELEIRCDHNEFPNLTFDNLEDYGYFNPFAGEDAYNAWAEGQEGLAAMGRTTRATDEDGIEFATDVSTVYRVPKGDSYDADLHSLTIIPINDTRFQMQLQVLPAEGDGITIGNIGNSENEEKIKNLPGMRAWRAFLISIIEGSGNTIDDDEVWGYDYSSEFNNRNYLWEQESGSEVRFQIQGLTIMSTGFNSAGNLRTLTVEFVVQTNTPDPYNEDLMQAYLDRETISTPVDNLALQPSTIGTSRSRGRFERLHIGDGWLYRRGDGHIVDNFVVGLNGEMEHIPITGDFGESKDMVNISVATGDTYKRIPVGPYVNSVHLAGSGVSADQNLQLPIPSKAIGLKNKDRDYLIHNKNATYKIQLRDWDGNIFFNVEPGERTYWRMTQEAWAHGELASVSLPSRHLVYTMSRDDLEELDDLVRLDTEETVDGSTVNGKAYVLPQPSSTSDWDFLHDDFFTIWTSGNFTTDLDILSETTKTNVQKVGAIEIVQDITGFLETDINISMKTKSGSSGSIEIPEIRIYRFRSNAVSAYVEQVTSNMWQSDKFYSHPLVHRGRVQKGDILIPVFWIEDGQSINDLDNVQIRQITFEMTVFPQVTLEYTP